MMIQRIDQLYHFAQAVIYILINTALWVGLLYHPPFGIIYETGHVCHRIYCFGQVSHSIILEDAAASFRIGSLCQASQCIIFK